jgi:hypothetical protein
MNGYRLSGFSRRPVHFDAGRENIVVIAIIAALWSSIRQQGEKPRRAPFPVLVEATDPESGLWIVLNVKIIAADAASVIKERNTGRQR